MRMEVCTRLGIVGVVALAQAEEPGLYCAFAFFIFFEISA